MRFQFPGGLNMDGGCHDELLQCQIDHYTDNEFLRLGGGGEPCPNAIEDWGRGDMMEVRLMLHIYQPTLSHFFSNFGTE